MRTSASVEIENVADVQNLLNVFEKAQPVLSTPLTNFEMRLHGPT